MGSRHHVRIVIARRSEAIHRATKREEWIASSLAVSNRCSLRRALAAAGIEPGINPALKARKSLQRLGVGERQQLHQDHADVARGIDPEIGVGEAGPGEAAGAAAFRRLGGVIRKERPHFLTMSG